MPNLALADLVIPYLLKANNLGANHAALSVIRVVSYETGSDDFGIVIRGHAEFNGQALIDVHGGRLMVASSTAESAPPFDPQRRSPIFDIRETSIDFELFVPREGSAILAQAATSITATTFTPVRNVFDIWDALPLDPAPSDYPSTGFTFDLTINAPTLRPPFLHPAKMTDRGLLIPDPSFQEVSIKLPKLRFRLAHGNPLDSKLTFELVSAGVAGLDDPGEIGEAELLSMEPPYAFVGGPDDRAFGIGFRKAVLDLSNSNTPPAIIEKFGFGDDWSGIYLPEARVFVAPSGARDLAIEAGVQDLLYGLGGSSGISGDFELALIDQGAGPLALGARFFDESGKAYGIERLSETTARVILPENTRMVIDIQGGLPPYASSLSINGGSPQDGRLFNIDVSAGQATLAISVHDTTAGTSKTAALTIQARKRVAQESLPTPGAQTPPTLEAKIDPPSTGTPRIIIANQTEREVTLTTDPQNSNILWSIVGGPAGETGPQASFSVPVLPGGQATVRARLPGTTVPTELAFYFYYEEPPATAPASEDEALGNYAQVPDNISTGRARSRARGDGREPGAQVPLAGTPPSTTTTTSPPSGAYSSILRDLVPPSTSILVKGEASYEGDAGKRDYNYLLARRRAIAVRESLKRAFSDKNFNISIDPEPRNPGDYPGLAAWTTEWMTHAAPNDRNFWRATAQLPSGLNQPEQQSNATIKRPAATSPPATIPVKDPPAPNAPRPPSWFRSAKLKARILKDTLVAVELEIEMDLQTASEERLNASGMAGGMTPSRVHTLENGAPLAPDNPADGITKFRVMLQTDQATGRITTLMQVGADPADKDGLAAIGWMPGETPNSDKDFWLTLLGSYISFWPLLVDMTSGNNGAIEDAVLAGTALAIPATVAALPWFRVERVILYGAEYLQRAQGGELEGFLLFDIEANWSAKISIFGVDLLEIDREHPLAVRYKAIGLRLGNTSDDSSSSAASDHLVLRPVFDSSRGYTIDVARGGSLKIAPPFDKILKILSARLSRTNPLTFEIDIGVGVDLGVISIDRARVRIYLDEPRPPELTAFGASIDIAGAIAGQGYLEMGAGDAPNTSKIGGQIDVTLRPISLRVAASLEVSDIQDGTRTATAVYLGLNVVLPVGIPLGSSGLGLFGFRGIFGMHYQRNTDIGSGSATPSLRWLEATGGQPHLLKNPTTGAVLWRPKADEWTFGIGALLGTMEGGVIINLDGTLLLELPGPRIVIVMNARILSPPPSVDGLGSSGGILAIIEITPDHFLIGLVAEYNIEDLIKIRVPVEAYFDFVDTSNWHFYMGQRRDYGDPVEVDVLGIVRGTGYLMIKGNGLNAFPEKNLPAITGFAIGVGAAASLTFGDVGAGLYLRVGGSLDAVVGFDPLIVAGHFELSGELRLFIISIGASANLDVLVIEKPAGNIQTAIQGEACGHVDFFFFSVGGCVHVEFGHISDTPDMPTLVQKLSLKSRSPALLVGTGVDRPIDTSLGDGIEAASAPSLSDPALVVVPIDSIPVISMIMPPQAGGLQFNGQNVLGSSGLSDDPNAYAQRGSEDYQYRVTAVALERVSPVGPAFYGTNTPATWWTINDPAKKSPTAQLALLTYEPDPAPKAIEKTEVRTESIRERWGTVCDKAAPPAPVLWTFLYEHLGPSPTGWDLEGKAWPDPAAGNTRRSTAPDTSLLVNEKWRSGNPQIDSMRGIIPAIVVGSRIKCQHGGGEPAGTVVNTGILPVLTATVSSRIDRSSSIVTRSSSLMPAREEIISSSSSTAAALPEESGAGATVTTTETSGISATAVKVTERLANKIKVMAPVPPPALSDPATTLGRLATGSDVSRAEAISALFAMPSAVAALPPATGQEGRCETKVLQSPMLDNGELIVIGDRTKREIVAKELEKAGIKHGPLDDVVVVHSNGFEECLVLLFVLRLHLETKRVVTRTLDKDGNQLSAVAATAADMVTSSNPLPSRWSDFSGPWAQDVENVLGWRQDPRASAYIPVLLGLKGTDKVDRFEVGLVPDPDEHAPGADPFKVPLAPPYYLAAMEMLRFSEITRSDYDSKEIEKEQEVITSVLGPAGTDNALLYPNSLYKVTTSWTGKRKSDGANRSADQTFWFKTDAAAPGKLDPWVLMTTPSDGEGNVFGAEPLHVVFNTHDVDRLFAAYGKELRVRILASSAHHPEGDPSTPHPFPINAATIIPAKAAILSPWEDALQQVLDGKCIPIDDSRDRQSVVTIPIPLDPYTDYRLYVEMVNLGSDANATGDRLYLRSFSTGAYGKLADFATDIQAVNVMHRSVNNSGAMEAIRASFAGRKPKGSELDEALRSAGVEALEPSQTSQLVVFWEQVGAGPPQPAAILVDVPEPLWRARPFPTKIVDTTGPSDAERWVMGLREWLRLEPSPGSSATIIAPDGIIRAPGDQRALVVLNPGSRGQRLRLDLVRPAVTEPYLPSAEERFTVVDITLSKAVWEEEEVA